MNDAPAAGPPAAPREAGATGSPGLATWVAALTLLVVLSLARFVELTERPLHHDEGVNAWKTEQLIERGYFDYDPANYHGPSLFFLQLVPTAASWALGGGGPLTAGITEASLRAGVAVAGCLLLVGVWLARRALGDAGALVALLLLGTSPGILYYSRDFIHEIHHVLFTLALWLALQRFASGGGRGPLLMAAAALALGFCTKETFPISVFGIVCGGVAAALGRRLEPGEPGRLAAARAQARDWWRRLRPHLWGTGLVAVAVWFLLFSSFFHYLEGPVDSFRAFVSWADTAASTGHDKDGHWYLTALVAPWEPALLGAAVFGLAVAALRREPVGLQLAVWAAVVLGVYSAIPYKTPWLVLNALLPMGLLGGWAVDRAIRWLRGTAGRAGVALAVALVVTVLGAVSWQMERARTLVYVEPDAPHHAYVYVQTRRDVRRLLSRIATAADPAHPEELTIDVVAIDYWPLPFYLDRYRARFWGGLDASEFDATLVIGNARQRAQVSKRLGSGWERLTYDLRPGVKLDLFTRSDGT